MKIVRKDTNKKKCWKARKQLIRFAWAQVTIIRLAPPGEYDRSISVETMRPVAAITVATCLCSTTSLHFTSQ